jgi:hypothetical protein
LDPATHGEEKRIKSAYLLHEPLKIPIVVGYERLPALGILKDHVPGVWPAS